MELNQVQNQAVGHTGSPLLLVAGGILVKEDITNELKQ